MTESNASSSGRGRLIVKRNRLISTSSDSGDEMPIVRRKRSHESDPSDITVDNLTSPKQPRVNNVSVNVNDMISVLESRCNPRPFINAHQMLNALPEFDPENKAQNINIWLHKVNEYAHMYNWDDRQTSHFATQKLVGTAKNWLYSLPSLDFSWPERRAFPVEDNFAVIFEEMFNKKTKPDESLRIYFYDKLMLLNRCEITKKKSVDFLVYGITDVSLRKSAQALRCQEPKDLLKYLVVQQPTLHFSNTQKKRGFLEKADNSSLTGKKQIRGAFIAVSKGTWLECAPIQER